MKIVIQKFGGSSLQDPEIRAKAVEHIIEAKAQGFVPVVVVSAMGRANEPYSTESLIKTATTAFKQISPREKDMIMSCGEVISAVVMVQSLRKMNLEAVSLNAMQAGIITNENYNHANVKKVVTDNILQVISAGKIPIVAGFQGITENGEITTLGRGGSDTTAGILAAALQADHIEIYSDVDGLLTADPKLVKNAVNIEFVNFTETVEMANKGAKVIHPKAVEIASHYNIPIKLFSTKNNKKTTLVHNVRNSQPVTGVTSKSKIIYTKLFPDSEEQFQKELSIFNTLAEQNISVDFINITLDIISFIVEEEMGEKLQNILQNKDYKFESDNRYTKISVVGSGMTGRPGVLAKIVNTLSNNDIKIYECTDSYTTISCLIENKYEKIAVTVLHNKFKLGNKE
ncbi:MAG: aspartate kinase [Candidatus Cloacimonetes bacterium]|nr:aspartate kinase [Candidatus Cloacimonadota bacterium]